MIIFTIEISLVVGVTIPVNLQDFRFKVGLHNGRTFVSSVVDMPLALNTEETELSIQNVVELQGFFFHPMCAIVVQIDARGMNKNFSEFSWNFQLESQKKRGFRNKNFLWVGDFSCLLMGPIFLKANLKFP